MAKFKSHMFSEIRGKISGSVHRANRFGLYIAGFRIPVNPKSVAQQLIRTRLAATAQAWRGLAATARDEWRVATENFIRLNVFSDGYRPSGFQLHNELNRNRQEINEPLLVTPPTPQAVDGFTSLTIEVIAGGALTATYAPAIPADQKVIVYASPGLSQGKNFVKSEMRKIDVLETGLADASPVNLATAYNAVFGPVPAAGTKVFVDFVPVHTASGIRGTRIGASDISS